MLYDRPPFVYGGDPYCSVHLLSSLSSVLSTLYEYGSDPRIPDALCYGGSCGTYSDAASPLSGFQATGAGFNPYNPVCPWPLINEMLSQIQQYINQMQAAQGGGGGLGMAGGFGTFARAPWTRRPMAIFKRK